MLFFSDCQPVNLALCLVPGAVGLREGRAPPRPQLKRWLGLLCFGVCGCSALKTDDYSCRRIVAALKRLDL